LPLQSGDRLVICSDGLNSMLDDREIAGALRAAGSPQDAADRLVDLANDAGGEDNITVVVIDIQDPGTPDEEGSEPAAEQTAAPVAASPPAEPAQAVVSSSKGKLKPRWARIALASVLVLAILGAGSYIAFRFLVLDRSYFVGVNESENVTIYRGLPGEVAGLELQEEAEVTDLHLADLPAFLQDNVRDGIDATSLEEARQQVADLQDRARDEEFGSKPKTQQDGQKKKDRKG
jgi:protein phosphatase